MGTSLDRYSLVQPQDSTDRYNFVKPPEPSALSYLGEFSRNAPKYINMYMATSDNPVANFIGNKILGLRRSSGISTPDIEEEVRRKVAEARGTIEPAKDIFYNDLSNMFGKFGSAFTDSDLSTIDKIKAVGSAIPQMVADLPKMAISPVEASIGIGLSERGQPVYTPEERADKIKDAAGILLSTALGMGSRLAMEGYYTSQAAKAVAVVGKGLAPPKLIGEAGRKLLTGFTEGAVAGTSYGAVARANESDQLSAVLMGLAFAPIGAAFEMLHKSKLDVKMKAADELFMTRQIQFKPEQSVLAETATMFEQIAKNNDMLLAIANTNKEFGKSHFVLQGLDAEYDSITKIRQTLGNEYGAVTYVRPDNKADLLVMAKDSKITEQQGNEFARSGFIGNEVVSYSGRDFIFTGETSYGHAANLRDPITGDIVPAQLSDLRRKTDFNLDNPEQAFQSDRSLKGIWTLQAKLGNPHIFRGQNYKVLREAKHGEPLKIIGFRQQRGPELAIDTGRFYGLDHEHVGQYNPYVYKGFTPEEIAAGETGYISKAGATGYSNRGKMVSPGRKIEGNSVETLLIHNLTFEKPFIFDGKHKGIWQELVAAGSLSNAPLSGYEKIVIQASDYAEFVKNYELLSTNISAPSELSWKMSKQSIEDRIAQLPKNSIADLFTEKERKAFIQSGEYIYNYNKYPNKTHPETGYQGMDRILKRVLTRNGYDGLVYRNPHSLGNSEVVSYRLAEIGQKHKAEFTGVSANVLDAEKFVNIMYDNFKPLMLSDTNTTPFNDLFHSFATQKGFSEVEMPALKASFEKRLVNDLQAIIPEHEKSVLKKAQTEIHQIQLDKYEQLRTNVHSNGMYFDTGDNGVIQIRDRETSKLLHTSQSVEEASEFVNKSGQMDTIDLDGNSSIPPSLINGNVPPAGGSSPFHEGAVPDLPTKAEQFIAHSEPSWLTRNRENFRNLDVIHNLGGAMLKIQDMLDSGRRLKIAAENPYLKRLHDIHTSLGGSADMDKKIPIWMEMRTSAERIQGGARGGRVMNTDEINLAYTLVGSKDKPNDITKMYKFIEYRRKLQKDGLNGKQLTKTERQVQYDLYKQKLGFTPEEAAALQALMMARRLPLDKLETGAAVRLAETLQAENASMITDRNVYATKHFNVKQLAAARQTEQLYKDLADRFGISQSTLLQGYFPHARTKFDGNLSRTLNEFKLQPKEKEFFARMVRTGEIRPHDDGLTSATQRYISAGFNELYSKKNINDAILMFKEEVLPKIKDAPQRKNAIAIFNSYKDSVMGKPHHLDKVANESFRKMLGTIGVDLPEDSPALQNLVSGAMMTITSATQGLRPALALRDLYTGLRSYGVKLLSIKKAAEAFNYGFNLKDAAVREALMESGEVAHYGILQFGGIETESAIANISSKIGRKLSDAETAMIKYGGQPTVYERLAAGFTIERKRATMEAARKYLAKSQTKEALVEAYKDLKLDSYDHSVQLNFDRLFQGGQYDEASRFLARQTVAETLGWYGQGNHPKGWNTYLGRMGGQFGNWSINYRDTILRSAAAGPMKDRVTRLATMAAFDGALTLAAAKVGVSFYNWMTLPAMVFMGGPSLDYVQAVNNSIFGFGQDKQVAQSKLKRLLPYNSDTDEWHLNQFYIPGGYFANDIAKAMEVNDDLGGGWAALRGAGFRVEDSYYKPGMLEGYLKEDVVEPINY